LQLSKQKFYGGIMYKSLIILMLILNVSLSAIQQDVSSAEVIAENFLNYKSAASEISETKVLSSRNENLVYIFSLDPDGFIAMSADSDVYPVIAYSFRNSLEEEGNLFLDILQEDVQKRLSYNNIDIQRRNENQMIWDEFTQGIEPTRDFEQWPPSGTTETDGWVETTWNQSGVYFNFCPLDNGGERSVVGCTATAMSMIMDFHRFIGSPVFTNADDYYTYNEGMLIDNDHEERDFPPFPELNEYLDDVVLHYSAGMPLTDVDKAALCFAAGVSVEMDYSSSGSGAWGVDYPLIYKFGYDSAEEVHYENYYFFDRMQENMKMMRPAEMAIYTASYTSGHAIIVDGYNTDDYYHLNFGWGSSNSTCWYLLPTGMPAGYAIIMSAVMDIEGGAVPVEVSGNVVVPDTSPVGAEIFLEGERYSYHYVVDDEDGEFILPAVLEGYYNATAMLNDRIHYQYLENIYIDENSNSIQFNLGNFESVTGNISAPIEVHNCNIVLYQNGSPVYQGVSAADGNFSIPDVLPGTYTATASMAGNYYAQQEITITLENQSFDLDLQHYNGELALTYSSYPEDIWHLVPGYTIGCAIKLDLDAVDGWDQDIISQVRFKSPISQEDGEITAQIWEGSLLIAEKGIDEFEQGEWITSDLENYIQLDPEKEYFVGYTITSSTGEFVYCDNGPRNLGKGAFIRHTDWVELQPDNFNFNFCIEAGIGTQESGSISGNISLQSGPGNILDVNIKAEDFVTHPDDSGNYSLPLKFGNYNVSAGLSGYTEFTTEGINIDEDNSTLTDLDIVLSFGVSAGEDIPDNKILLENYPNPFNPVTTINFQLRSYEENINLEIFNIKGQMIRSYNFKNVAGGALQSVSWEGNDESGNPVSSGIYYYRLSGKDHTISRKMLLMK